jgi:hypothetical protein
VDHPKWNQRNLRIVDNNTRDYWGGFSVEHGDWVVAGPYAAKCDAVEAKRCLIAGEPVPPVH